MHGVVEGSKVRHVAADVQSIPRVHRKVSQIILKASTVFKLQSIPERIEPPGGRDALPCAKRTTFYNSVRCTHAARATHKSLCQDRWPLFHASHRTAPERARGPQSSSRALRANTQEAGAASSVAGGESRCCSLPRLSRWKPDLCAPRESKR